MAKAYDDPEVIGGTVLHLDVWETRALAGLLNDEAGDDGPLLDILEALAPTWTAEPGDRCHGCGEALPEDEVLWATTEGRLTVSEGLPWCAGCAPEEPQQ